MSNTLKPYRQASLWRRLQCALGHHDLQIAFTLPSGEIIRETLSCVTCEHCGGKWVTCLQDKSRTMIPFWQIYSAQDEVAMRTENEERGVA
jgi:hypothetical protein